MSKMASAIPAAGAISTDPVIIQIFTEDPGVRRRDAFPIEILGAVILLSLGDGQADAASAESESLHYLDGHSFLLDLVESDDAERRGP